MYIFNTDSTSTWLTSIHRIQNKFIHCNLTAPTPNKGMYRVTHKCTAVSVQSDPKCTAVSVQSVPQVYRCISTGWPTSVPLYQYRVSLVQTQTSYLSKPLTIYKPLAYPSFLLIQALTISRSLPKNKLLAYASLLLIQACTHIQASCTSNPLTHIQAHIKVIYKNTLFQNSLNNAHISAVHKCKFKNVDSDTISDSTQTTVCVLDAYSNNIQNSPAPSFNLFNWAV